MYPYYSHFRTIPTYIPAVDGCPKTQARSLSNFYSNELYKASKTVLGLQDDAAAYYRQPPYLHHYYHPRGRSYTHQTQAKTPLM